MDKDAKTRGIVLTDDALTQLRAQIDAATDVMKGTRSARVEQLSINKSIDALLTEQPRKHKFTDEQLNKERGWPISDIATSIPTLASSVKSGSYFVSDSTVSKILVQRQVDKRSLNKLYRTIYGNDIPDDDIAPCGKTKATTALEDLKALFLRSTRYPGRSAQLAIAETILEDTCDKLRLLMSTDLIGDERFVADISLGYNFLVQARDMFSTASRIYATSIDTFSSFWHDHERQAKDYTFIATPLAPIEYSHSLA